MGVNTFGEIFTFTTFGESHGKATGVVVDGCPAGVKVSDEEIQKALLARAPGTTAYVSPRKEPDHGELLSGVYKGETTGAPIAYVVWNKDADSSKYTTFKDVYRPGHANYTYHQKYGVHDYRGGGRASARETIGRVVAGCIAEKILNHFDIQVFAFLQRVGHIFVDMDDLPFTAATKEDLYCPDPKIAKKMQEYILQVKAEGDSIGGVVAFMTNALPVGLGEPIYQKLEAKLALAMMSLPASKGFEIGTGFASSKLKGSEHNDAILTDGKTIRFATNNAGGSLGGITNGDPVWGRVAFKPASSIFKTQQSASMDLEPKKVRLPEGSRHDPCVAIRAVPIVKAMLSTVLVDLILQNRSSSL